MYAFNLKKEYGIFTYTTNRFPSENSCTKLLRDQQVNKLKFKFEITQFQNFLF